MNRSGRRPAQPPAPHPTAPRWNAPAYPPRTPAAPPQPRRPEAKRRAPRLWLWLAAALIGMTLLTCGGLSLWVGLIYMDGILPGVQAGGVALGGLRVNQAEREMAEAWSTIIVRDEQRVWRLPPAELGITLDVAATVEKANAVGRSDLSRTLAGLLGRVTIEPVITVDRAALEAALNANAEPFALEPVNAGVAFADGELTPTAPQNGRVLDVGATLAQVERDPMTALADGQLELVMQAIAPAVTDATPMLEQARALLANPLDIRIYDPLTGDSVYWSVPPDQWASWLSAVSDPASPTGLALTANAAPVEAYLQQQSAVLDASRYLKLEEAVANVQATVAQGRTTPWTRVYHRDRSYVVQAGETITSIAWNVGVPYLYIVQANGGLEAVSPGQTITIPSPDTFLPYAVNPDKRIVVSISQQRVWVYENGQVKWEWLASTGIADSPTWPGLYQIISHEPNAYAGNWDLYMPYFMGVYQPIPGADFTNGFHGFPTRGGWQLLWTNSLGTRVTYGCILLSDTNIKLLYDWAETGVVVEIQA